MQNIHLKCPHRKESAQHRAVIKYSFKREDRRPPKVLYLFLSCIHTLMCVRV